MDLHEAEGVVLCAVEGGVTHWDLGGAKSYLPYLLFETDPFFWERPIIPVGKVFFFGRVVEVLSHQLVCFNMHWLLITADRVHVLLCFDRMWRWEWRWESWPKRSASVYWSTSDSHLRMKSRLSFTKTRKFFSWPLGYSRSRILPGICHRRCLPPEVKRKLKEDRPGPWFEESDWSKLFKWFSFDSTRSTNRYR